jgi:F-type H+-transporting ATPase subunit c
MAIDPQTAAEAAVATVKAGKAIGAGLAMTGMIGAGIGVGNIFGNFLSGALRNPSAAGSQIGNLFVGAALAEALGILSFVIGFLLYVGSN